MISMRVAFVLEIPMSLLDYSTQCLTIQGNLEDHNTVMMTKRRRIWRRAKLGTEFATVCSLGRGDRSGEVAPRIGSGHRRTLHASSCNLTLEIVFNLPLTSTTVRVAPTDRVSDLWRNFLSSLEVDGTN